MKRQFHVRGLLEESLAGNSLEVFLQPLVEASSGRVEGAEALVRMKDKDGPSWDLPSSLIWLPQRVRSASWASRFSPRYANSSVTAPRSMRHEVGARQCGPVQCLRRCLAEA